MYFPEEPDPVELALVNAAEKIADLESCLEMAALREANCIKEISNLRNELAATLRQQEARIAGEKSYSSTQHFPSLSHRHGVSPFTTPSKGKNSVARFPQLTHVSTPSHSEISMSSSFHESLCSTKPKQEGDGVTTLCNSNLGLTTTEFIKAYDLT